MATEQVAVQISQFSNLSRSVGTSRIYEPPPEAVSRGWSDRHNSHTQRVRNTLDQSKHHT